jgi:multidrug efflux pump subunit AcrA (membrane-fusion protein)
VPVPSERRQSRSQLWILLTTVIVLVLVFSLFLAMRHPSTAEKLNSSLSNRPTAFVRLKGTTEAVESRAILTPPLAGQQVSTLTIVRMASAGSRVKKGDLLVEFDRQAQTRTSSTSRQNMKNSSIRSPKNRRKKMPPVQRTRLN